jgi:hypothetical protein
VIVQRGVIDFLHENKFPLGIRLTDYLDANFAKAFSLEKFEFWVRRERTIVPLATAEVLQLKTPNPGLAVAKIELVVALPAGSKIAQIELATLEDTPRILAHWDKSTGPLFSTAINLQGAPLAPEPSSAWEQTQPPLARLELLLQKHLSLTRSISVIYLRDNQGELLAECRFIE